MNSQLPTQFSWYKSINEQHHLGSARSFCGHILLSLQKQSGAVEACWAHNPEVRGSKPRSAKPFPQLSDTLACKINFTLLIHCNLDYCHFQDFHNFQGLTIQ